MKNKLKELRERLQDAVDTKDWWVVKSQMNKLDTILFNIEKKEQLERVCAHCQLSIDDCYAPGVWYCRKEKPFVKKHYGDVCPDFIKRK